MTITAILAFSTAMLILAATPGPGVFATVARSLASGFKASLPLIAGIILGDILYLLFAVLGLSVIARTMAGLFILIKFIGSGYLVYIGIRMWTAAPENHLREAEKSRSPGRNFVSGLLITLSNPKVILFYCGFLPTFVNLTSLTRTEICLLALLVTVVLAAVLCTYSLMVSQSRQLFRSSRAMGYFNRTGGTVMAATGVIIATRG
jgi:threonine/homoserine/homoserine lactone efflux protein